MRLYLVRHGQTAWNAEERAQGHSDIPLDHDGERQAASLGHAFQELKIDLVLCSDLQRAQQTAKPIVEATGARFETTKLLRERGFGDWEGEPFADIANRWITLEAFQNKGRLELRPPNGESFLDVWERIKPITKRLLEAKDHEEHVAVVSHGGTCSLLLAQLIQGNLETSRAFRFFNTGVTSLERRPEGLFMIRRYNDTSHLDIEDALSGSVDGASR